MSSANEWASGRNRYADVALADDRVVLALDTTSR